MYIAGDLRVEHSIASMDYDQEMSPRALSRTSWRRKALMWICSYLRWSDLSQLLRLFVRTRKAIPSLREQDLFQNRVGVFLAETVPYQSTPAGTLAAATQETGHPCRLDGQMIR